MASTTTNTVRLSIIQADEYGPWTTTPAPRRETDLQALQARLYADFADFVGHSDGYAFYSRFDNMVGVANQIAPTEYRRFQERVRNRYPITVSIGVGDGPTPLAAVESATERLQAAGSAQDPNRREALRADDALDPEDAHLTVGHFDIVDVTGSITDKESVVDAHTTIQQSVMDLKKHLLAEYESVAHFVGGDNVIAICPPMRTEAFESIVEHLRAQTGIEYQVGIGTGATAHEAGHEAKHALEECRETGTRVVGHGVREAPRGRVEDV
jgi:GTP cyclohydrolase IIa